MAIQCGIVRIGRRNTFSRFWGAAGSISSRTGYSEFIVVMVGLLSDRDARRGFHQ